MKGRCVEDVGTEVMEMVVALGIGSRLPKARVHEKRVKYVKEVKYLGIRVSECMNFRPQVESLKGTANCANILGVFMYPSISHQMVYHNIMQELSLRGHHVTVVTPDPVNNPAFTNLTEIDIHCAYDLLEEKNVQKLFFKDLTFYDITRNFFQLLEIIADRELSSPSFKKLLGDHNRTFDLILVELMHPVMYALSGKFKAPVIGLMSMNIFNTQYDAVGNVNHPVLYPDFVINLPAGNMMLWEKVQSLAFFVWNRYYYQNVVLVKADKLVKKYFGDLAYISEYENSVSMSLLNRHHQIQSLRPNVPAVVEILPLEYHSPKPLPNDLQRILDDAKTGVVYFSLGTNVRMSRLEPQIRENILQALAELPYQVLLKCDVDLPKLPTNVVIRNWFPQKDLLAHNNVKVFVTHGGLHSLEEAVSSQIPIVGIPFYADQPENVRKFVALGIGEQINPTSITATELKEVIVKVAGSKMYKDNIRKVSGVVSDKPRSGLEDVIWWSEYVIKHGGAKHLKSSSVHMSWVTYFFLDVIAITIAIVAVSMICDLLKQRDYIQYAMLVSCLLLQPVMLLVAKLWISNELNGILSAINLSGIPCVAKISLSALITESEFLFAYSRISQPTISNGSEGIS
ncbi:UDP-glucosyltransferase 2-like [Zophobas morio]|uniref:UDP-glucosyltransferase 2-like n=1 Tax=Zophobas morio TaxID=2755281 RepID=UPI003083AA05